MTIQIRETGALRFPALSMRGEAASAADFDALEAEIIAAREGEPSLDAKLDIMESAAAATTAEVIAAREGRPTLDSKLDVMESAAAATTAEVVQARSGYLSLDSRIDAIQGEIVTARDGAASLDTRLDGMAATTQSVADEIMAARDGAISLDARLDAMVVPPGDPTVVGTGDIVLFADRGDAAAATIGAAIDIVEVLSGTASPGHADIFHRTGAGPASDEKFQSADGAWWLRETTKYDPAPAGTVARPYVQKFAEQISLLDFVSWTAADDVTVSEQAAYDVRTFIESAGRKLLYIPSRKFNFAHNTNLYCISALSAPSGLTIRGDGPSSVIYVPDTVQMGGISLSDIDDVTIEGLTVDCNRAGNPISVGVHGIRGGRQMLGLHILNVNVLNTDGYGIGLQGGLPVPEGETYSYEHIKFDNIYIENAGKDGIDIKNHSVANDDIQLSNITINGFSSDLVINENAGIDIRGPGLLSNIRVIGTAGANDTSGIRFRHGDEASIPGGEGRRSGVSNFSVTLTENFAVNQPADHMNIGVDVESIDCHVVGGYVSDCDVGVQVANYAERCRVSNIHTTRCGYGFNCAGYSGIMLNNVSGLDNVTADAALGAGVRVANAQFMSIGQPANIGPVEIIDAFWTGTAWTGMLRTDADKVAHFYEGAQGFTFDEGGRINAYPTGGTFTNHGVIELPAGSNYALSIKTVDTGENNLFSFASPSGPLITVSMSASALVFRDASGSMIFSMGNDAIGFFGGPVAKPTITGSQGGNAALASLLGNLHNMGLITNSTTA